MCFFQSRNFGTGFFPDTVIPLLNVCLFFLQMEFMKYRVLQSVDFCLQVCQTVFHPDYISFQGKDPAFCVFCAAGSSLMAVFIGPNCVFQKMNSLFTFLNAVFKGMNFLLLSLNQDFGMTFQISGAFVDFLPVFFSNPCLREFPQACS